MAKIRTEVQMNQPKRNLGTCSASATGKENPTPFHPGSRAPTRRDTAKHHRRVTCRRIGNLNIRDAIETPHTPGAHLQLLHAPKALNFPRQRLQGGYDAPGAAAAHPTPGFELSPGKHGRGGKESPQS